MVVVTVDALDRYGHTPGTASVSIGCLPVVVGEVVCSTVTACEGNNTLDGWVSEEAALAANNASNVGPVEV